MAAFREKPRRMPHHIRHRSRIRVLKFVATASLMAFSSTFAADVLTWHNDLARTGLNAREWALRPDNVNADEFGKLFLTNLDGQVYAQPLIVSALNFPGWGVYNVLYVVTEHDSVYAIDADTGFLLWHVQLVGPGETPADTDECDPITPEVGITATPVIDRTIGPNGTMYVVTVSKDAAGHYYQRLHALNLTTGTEQFGGPVEVIASYPGTGDNSSNGNVIFDPAQYYERAALALSNGIVFTTWASRHDCRPYTSWVIGYDAHTLQQVRVLNLTHNGYQGGIWQSAAAPAIDPNGFLYVTLGNGKFDTTLDTNGFPSQGNYGNCFVKLAPANNSLSVADYWTMFNSPEESSLDQDLGSSGPIVLPDMTDGNGIQRHLAVAAGKDAHIYIADRDNMGKYNPTANSTLYQELSGSLGAFNFSTPSFFNGWLYFGAVGDVLRGFSFTNARMNSGAVTRSLNTFGFPGTSPTISANGTTSGVLWAAENVDPAVLHAYDAGDLSHELYNTNQASNSRDNFGSNTKFGVPTVANGKVYVASTNGAVGAFGLYDPPRLTRSVEFAYVGLDNNVLVGKFVVQGSGSKNVVFRALGPSLGINDKLQDPVIELYDNNGYLITYNNDWATDSNAGQLQAYGLAPSDPHEAALSRTLATGSYLLVVRGAGNTTGIGQLEMYDLSQPPTATVSNMSARGLIAGGDLLIGALTVTGRASQTVLFRAIGPELISQGIAFALRDPTLEVYDVNGNLIASNDNWKSNQQTQIQATGLAPTDDREAAILLNLQPGLYFTVVRGAGGTIGIAQAEAFALQL